jgi:hypothetical protein
LGEGEVMTDIEKLEKIVRDKGKCNFLNCSNCPLNRNKIINCSSDSKALSRAIDELNEIRRNQLTECSRCGKGECNCVNAANCGDGKLYDALKFHIINGVEIKEGQEWYCKDFGLTVMIKQLDADMIWTVQNGTYDYDYFAENFKPANESVDNVNNPTHYNNHPSGVECIDITRHMNFNIGNAIKYLWRHGKKDQDKTIEDLKKAEFYIKDEIKRLQLISKDK